MKVRIPRHAWRATFASIGLFLAFVTLRSAASDPPPSPPSAPTASPLERRFRDDVQPFLGTYCVECHGKEKPKGDLDLSAYSTMGAVAGDHETWEAVLEQLEGGS